MNEKVAYINGNKLNNLRSNLRFCTHRENMQNSKPYCNGTSKYKGVHLLKFARKNKIYKYWRARIVVNNKRISLGCYKSEREVAKAYDRQARKEFGEFARFNFS